MPLGMEVGLGKPHCVRWEPAGSPTEKGTVRLCGFRHISTSGVALVGRRLLSCLQSLAPYIASLDRYGLV